MARLFAEVKPDPESLQRRGRTRRIDTTTNSVLRKELKADPNWADVAPTGFEGVIGERKSLRARKKICYAEADLPDLDLFLFCDDCEVWCFIVYSLENISRLADS
jgi:hypothetical protein